MSDTEQLIPELYRDTAQQVRELPRMSRLTDIRGQLLELSASFERMAAYADAAIRLGAPSYPHGERLPIASAVSVARIRGHPYARRVSPCPIERQSSLNQTQ